MDEREATLQRNSTIQLTINIAFLVELIIKLIAVEWKLFVSQRLNLMDVILCIVFLGFFIAD